MNDADKLLAAWRTGHFWDASKPDLLNVDESSLQKLSIDHPIARQAFLSWQESDANFDLLVLARHKRVAVFDGIVGPATDDLITLPRCAMPDFPPPQNVSFDYGDAELNGAVQSYQRWAASRLPGATGTGSWPVGCDPLRKDVHSVVVKIDLANAGTTQKAMADEVLRYVEETEAEIGQSVRHVRDGSVSNPQHDVKFQFIAGGVIGFAYFPDPNECNQTVTARIDNSFQPRATVLAELLTHEYKGHSDGLEHTRGGIMNPSIGSPTTRPSWKGDTSESVKRRYFGGEPIPGPAPPIPVPPGQKHPPIDGAVFAEPFPGGIAIRGDVTLRLAQQPAGDYKYIVIPDGAGLYKLTPKPIL